MNAVTQFCLIAAATVLTPHFVYASCGTVEVSKGDIKIESAATHAVKAAPQGSKICSGDKIIAGADSRAKLKMEDGNELNVSPDSQIVLENYQFDAAENKKKVLLNVLSGKVRATTKKENMYNDRAKDGQANTFEVRTKSAVAGVRGTDFLTGYDPQTQKTEVVTFRGRVEVAQMGASGKHVSVPVVAGQKVEVSAGQTPSAPRAIPAAELSRVNNESRAETVVPKADLPAAAPMPDAKKDSTDTTKKAPNAATTSAPTSAPVAAAPTTTTVTETRAPSSVSAPAVAPAPPPPVAMGLPPANTIVLPPKVPTIPQINPCGAICDNAIQNRAAKVKIIIRREGN